MLVTDFDGIITMHMVVNNLLIIRYICVISGNAAATQKLLRVLHLKIYYNISMICLKLFLMQSLHTVCKLYTECPMTSQVNGSSSFF